MVALRGEELLAQVGLPLSVMQRILLTTDGTVTHVLEAYGSEAMRVIKLQQSNEVELAGEPGLEMSEPERVLRRTILLRGASTQENYLYAHSVILADRLHPVVSDGLVATDRPIGKLLIESRMETFREVLECCQEPAGGIGGHFGLGPSAILVSRTYRVITAERPVMLITEKFPAGAWADWPGGHR